MKALLAVWNAGASYSSRIAAVQNTSTPDYLKAAGPGQTVLSDKAVDQLTGSARPPICTSPT